MSGQGDRRPRQEAVIAQQGPEQRQCPRYDVELDMHIGSEHNFYSGFVENLSVGGVFVATHQVKELGEQIDFRVFLPGRDEPVSGKGEVRWLRPYNQDSDTEPGMGIRFLELDGDGDEAIRRFIAKREPLFFDDE